MAVRRICFYGGPGAGKSTLAMRVAAELKGRGIEAELIAEYVKAWSFLKLQIHEFDQVYILAKQLRQEDVVLRASNSVIVTDSPPLMSIAYAKKYRMPCWENLMDIAVHFEKAYPTLNIFVDRTGLPYSTVGRYETYEQAVSMDKMIMDLLNESGVSWRDVRFDDFGKIMSLVEDALED